MGQPSGLALAVVTWTRSGGGYLMECLNSHPLIRADSASYWKKKLRHKINPVLVRALLGRTGCRVSATKLLCTEAGRIPDDFWIGLQARFIEARERRALHGGVAGETGDAGSQTKPRRRWHTICGKRGRVHFPVRCEVRPIRNVCHARCTLCCPRLSRAACDLC